MPDLPKIVYKRLADIKIGDVVIHHNVPETVLEIGYDKNGDIRIEWEMGWAAAPPNNVIQIQPKEGK